MADGNTTRRNEPLKPAPRQGERLFLHGLYPELGLQPVPLTDGLLLGRLGRCDVALDLETVSRQHAQIVREGPRFVIRDLDSANGTYVDGQRQTSATLRAGSILRVGSYVALVQSSTTPGTSSGVTEIAPGILGGPSLMAALSPALRAATSSVAIEISGETGTGKELVARAVHQLSQRQGRFHALNCAAIPQTMVEGELFGYRRGAFSGAERANPGHFRAADKGTLLLDEIEELSPEIQAKMLRVLQEREVMPLGEVRPVPVDVRVIVAGQQPLEAAVQQGRLRPDVRMRLRGVRVQLPALRERIEDIPSLFTTFLKQCLGSEPRLEAELVEALCLYSWPGNVRELLAETQRICALHRRETVLRASLLWPDISQSAQQRRVIATDHPAEERTRLARALRAHDGIVSRASRSAGISRGRAYRILNGSSVTEFLKQTAPDDEPH